jgi:hypothetical protein
MDQWRPRHRCFERKARPIASTGTEPPGGRLALGAADFLKDGLLVLLLLHGEVDQAAEGFGFIGQMMDAGHFLKELVLLRLQVESVQGVHKVLHKE